MPFGLTNAPATFNRLMTDLFRTKLDDFVLVFFDDILIYSKPEQEHEKHLRRVLDILREAKLYAKKSKCSFFTDKVAYLGYIISRQGLSPDPEKVEAIVKWPIPKSMTEVRSFMGLARWCRTLCQGVRQDSRAFNRIDSRKRSPSYGLKRGSKVSTSSRRSLPPFPFSSCQISVSPLR